MGDVKKYLAKTKLPERQKHNSRLFIDLAENIHIHHREYRTVFSIDEFLEYTDVVLKAREELFSYLHNNPDYTEMKYPTTILVSGGREQQLKFLENSPKPTQSAYYDDSFAIELQEEYVADEIHIHYRDFRTVFNRKNFRIIAEAFAKSLKELDKFEAKHKYDKEHHPDVHVEKFNKSATFRNTVEGAKEVELKIVKSNWFADILEEMKPNEKFIKVLVQKIKEDAYITPIVLSTEKDGSHKVVDGHHRVYASLKAKKKTIFAIVLDETFDETEEIRKAENLLKQFDKKTEYKYNLSNYFKSFISAATNKFYYNNFQSLMYKVSLRNKIKRRIKRIISGKKAVFFSFNETKRK